jgi:hypothetical protein
MVCCHALALSETLLVVLSVANVCGTTAIVLRCTCDVINAVYHSIMMTSMSV